MGKIGKISWPLFTVISLLAFPVMAQPPAFQSANVTNPVNGDVVHQVNIPPQALNGASIVPLSTVVHNGKVVEGFMFVHYKDGYGHRENHAKGGKPSGGASQCYAFLSKGARWKVAAEPYLVDPTNSGLDGTTVRNLVAASLKTWDDQVVGFDIFGSEDITDVVDGIDQTKPDGKNEVLFGNIDSPGAIAVTIVWGIFGGPPFARELIEWDVLFDSVDFDWSTSGEPGKMDFQNIATHEFGHAAGLGHPSSSCVDETMYAYADYGETKKQDLHAGDIAGIKELYK